MFYFVHKRQQITTQATGYHMQRNTYGQEAKPSLLPYFTPFQLQWWFQQLFLSISLLKIKRNGLQVPLAAYQPSAVSLYWMTSGAMAVLLNLLLMEPRLISHDPSGQWLNHEPYYVKTAINDINPG